MSSLSATLWILISASSIKAVVSRCNTNNLYTEFVISEDEAIGRTTHIWSTVIDDPWTILKPNSTFVDLYFQNDTADVSLYVNVTGDIDLDKGARCTGIKETTFTLNCETKKWNLTIKVSPVNEHTPIFFNNRNMNTSVPEDAPLLTQLIKYGSRVKDDDCPKQNFCYAVASVDSAVANKRDGTQYFDINENGTLYLKRALDYETVVCALGESGELYLNVLIKDDGADQMTGTVSLTMTVLDVDDAPPKFLYKSIGCLEKCSDCEQKSYVGNVTFDYTGIVPVHPMIQAKDIENNKSQIIYSILETKPKEYGGIISINDLDGTLTVDHSFQNVSGIKNITQTEDFYVLVTIQASSNRTVLKSNNATVNISVEVPPETTTMEQTTEEQTTIEPTTESETTTEIITTSVTPEVTTKRTTLSVLKSGNDDNETDIVIIVVPIAAAIFVIILIIFIYLKRKAMLSKNIGKYKVDGNRPDLQTDGVKVEKISR